MKEIVFDGMVRDAVEAAATVIDQEIHHHVGEDIGREMSEEIAAKALQAALRCFEHAFSLEGAGNLMTDITDRLGLL